MKQQTRARLMQGSALAAIIGVMTTASASA